MLTDLHYSSVMGQNLPFKHHMAENIPDKDMEIGVQRVVENISFRLCPSEERSTDSLLFVVI